VKVTRRQRRRNRGSRVRAKRIACWAVGAAQTPRRQALGRRLWRSGNRLASRISPLRRRADQINQPIVPQFLMSARPVRRMAPAHPDAMLSSMFGRMMPDALEKLRRRHRRRRHAATGRPE